MSTDDSNMVTLAANHLDVSEFEIFRASYRSWYSDDVPDSLLERHFGEYLKHGDVPFWVRHFARDRLSQGQDAQFTRGDLLNGLAMMALLYAPQLERAVDACTPALAA